MNENKQTDDDQPNLLIWNVPSIHAEELRKQIFGNDIPRVPESILDGSMTLKEFSQWGQTVEDVQMRDDLVIRKWLTPYLRMSLKIVRKRLQKG